MRDAKYENIWVSLPRKQYENRIEVVEFEKLVGIGGGRLNFKGGITAMCGANGVGKTTILNAIRSALVREESALDPGIRGKLAGSVVKSEMMVRGKPLTRTVSVGDKVELQPAVSDLEVVHINPSEDVLRLIGELKDSENIKGLKEGVEENTLSKAELSQLSRVVGRVYEGVSVFELEVKADDISPHFEVDSGGLRYETLSMGLGELAIHYLLWRLRQASNNSIVLIEEPETFLAPHSQANLLDELASYSLTHGHWVILTTHSEGILRRLEHSQVRLLVRDRAKVTISEPRASAEYLRQLGIPHRRQGVVLVEDDFAQMVCETILSQLLPGILHQIEIVVAGDGVSGICRALRFPRVKGGFSVVGLLDGDESLRDHRHDGDSVVWPHCYLPGTESPEAMLFTVATKSASEICKVTGLATETMERGMAEAGGGDVHDRLPALAKGIGLSMPVLVWHLMRVWCSDPANEKLARKSVTELENALEF